MAEVLLESYVVWSDGVAVERQRWMRSGVDPSGFRPSHLRALALATPAAVAASAGTARVDVSRVAVQPRKEKG